MTEDIVYKKITQEDLNAILIGHEKWLDSDGMEGNQANLSFFDLSEDTLPGAFANYKRLNFINLEGANLSRAHLEGADFYEAHIERANLTEAHLEGAEFTGAHLEGAELWNTNLEEAELLAAHFEYANLYMAHLKGANLSEAHLEGAVLQYADLRNCDISDVTYDRNISCSGVRLEGCYGSPLFKRFLEDQEYLEEFQLKNPKSYKIWLMTADCGRSTLRWTCWAFGLIVLFAIIYMILGPEHFKYSHDGLPWGLVACIYYSVVTFSTLGFGDITPKTEISAFLVMIEVFMGYVMLGGLISIFANKLARRS